jgi:hypothetical protein
MRRPPLAAVVLLLGISLSSGPLPLSARPLPVARSSRTEAPTPSWAEAWETAVRKLVALLKNGSGIDPFGHPAGSTSTPPSGTGDNGSGVDPFGGK